MTPQASSRSPSESEGIRDSEGSFSDSLQPGWSDRRAVANPGSSFPDYVALEPEDDEKALIKLFSEDYRLIPMMVIFDKAGRRVWTSGDGPKLSDEQLDKKIEDLLSK